MNEGVRSIQHKTSLISPYSIAREHDQFDRADTQVDKESGVLEEEKGVWGPQGGERDTLIFLFFPYIPSSQ